MEELEFNIKLLFFNFFKKILRSWFILKKGDGAAGKDATIQYIGGNFKNYFFFYLIK